MREVEISAATIKFLGYPYPPSSVYADGVVGWGDVREVNLVSAPPEIRLVSGEILFVPAAFATELRTRATEAGVPIVTRIDVWALILEPFLDTRFDSDDQTRTMRMLEENGVTSSECARIRRSLRLAMMAYNGGSGLWEWCHLGLADALDARLGHLVGASVPRILRLGPAKFKQFYWNAMEIANRAKVKQGKPISKG